MQEKKCYLCGEILDSNRKKYCDICRDIRKRLSIQDIIDTAIRVTNHVNKNTAAVKPCDSSIKAR